MKKILSILIAILLYGYIAILNPSWVQAQQSGILDEEFINNFTAIAAETAKKYGNKIAAYEIWNEGDLANNPSSIYLNPQDYSQLLKATYEAIKANSSSQVIVGGLASGNVGYLTDMGTINADGIGIHPYILDINTLQAKVSEYQSVSQGKPLWVTEFGWETPNQQDQANYLVNAFNVFRTKGVAVSVWYCWSDSMNPGFGLIDQSGNHKLSYENFPQGGGVNIDPQHEDNPTANNLNNLGAKWVRLVYKPLTTLDFDSLIENYNNAGIKIILILNQETLSPNLGPLPGASPITLNKMGGVRSNWTETSITKTEKPVPGSPNSNVSGAVLGLFSQLVNGKVIFNEQEPPRFPGITVLKNNFLNAFNSLLPEKKAKTASLPGTTELKTVTSVFPINPDANGGWTVDNTYQPVCYNGEPRPDEDVAKEQTTVPSSWGQFVGSAVAVAGLGMPAAKLTDLSLYKYFRYQFPKIDWQCLWYSFGPGTLAAPKATENTNNKKPEFKVTLTAIIEEILDTVKQVLNIKETKKVEVRVNTQLAGVGNARDKTKEVNRAYTTEKNFKELNQVTEAKALAGDLRAGVIMSPLQEGSHQLDYYDFLPIRNNACFPVCGAYTQQRVSDGSQKWVGQNKFCPSCDPEDYKAPFIPIPKPPNVPPNCHWNKAYGCDYWNCHYKSNSQSAERTDIDAGNSCWGCGENEVPFCEDTGGDDVKCGSPLGLNIPKDVRAGEGGPCAADTPGYNKVCLASGGGECETLIFTSSVAFYQAHRDLAIARGLNEYIDQIAAIYADGPPYGPCFYANPGVCARKGYWNDWNNCGVMCAQLCCGT